MKNYRMAMSFGRRLLNLGPRPEVAQNIRKVVQVSLLKWKYVAKSLFIYLL